MQYRDRQNEILVALVVIITMAFALIFSIVLSLDEDKQVTPEQTLIADIATSPAPTITPSNSPDTPQNSVSPTTRPSTLSPKTLTPTNKPPTETASFTPSHTPTQTPTKMDTPTQTPSRTITPSQTSFGQARTPIRTATPNLTDQARIANLTSSPTEAATATVIALQATAFSPIPCQPRQDWDTYRVDLGDTLFSIAKRYKIGVLELALANCLSNPRLIYAGALIYVPPSHPEAMFQGCETLETAILAPKTGDSVSGIIQIHGVAYGDNFQRYTLAWRADESPNNFSEFHESTIPVEVPHRLGEFDTQSLPKGLYWFRVRVYTPNNRIRGECAIRIRLIEEP